MTSTLARSCVALDTSLDQLVEPVDDADVVIRPEPHVAQGVTVWPLSRDGAAEVVSIFDREGRAAHMREP